MKLFSLIYTSVRTEQIASVIAIWRSRAANWDNCEVVLALDDGAVCPLLPESVSVYIQGQAPFNCTRGWNLAAAKANGKVLVLVSDDIMPPERWDEALLAVEDGAWVDKEAVLHVADGYGPNKLTHAIMTRARYERLGYFFYPEYESMYNDQELWEQALQDGVVIDARHLLFEHIHPDAHKRERDSVDLVQSGKQRYQSGKVLFERRKAAGFPIDQGPKAPFVAFMQVTQDDFFLAETCQRLVEEGVSKIFMVVPSHYWSGKPVAPFSVEGLPAEVEIWHRPVEVTTFRVCAETQFRNACMAEIRALGYRNILIVDGDELWRRGTLAKVKAHVQSGVTTLKAPMVSVIGLPGYPIDGNDCAALYYGASEHIGYCRSPVIPAVRMDEPCLFHFTGTRKTMAAMIEKYRESGHYDDPKYNFEHFIQNVLPYIKPGMKAVHPYLLSDTWPVVREWRAEELAEIPLCYHPYLATGKD